MKIGKYVKAPAERHRYILDYSEWLDTGEKVAGTTFTLTNDRDPDLGPPVPPDSDIFIDGTLVAADGLSTMFFVNTGVAGVTYTVSALTTTTGSQIKEDQIVFVVKEP